MLGILLMNIVGFAMPEAAYLNPAAYGARGPADLVVWAVNAVLVDGRMRGLFSFLFGASLCLVADRAEAAGESAAAVHYRRMGWLFGFGLAHLILVWWGDILHHYALVGCVAFLLRRLAVEKLVAIAIVLLIFQTVLAAGLPVAMAEATAAIRAPHPSDGAIAAYQALEDAFGHPSAAAIAAELRGYRGGYLAEVAYRWPEALATPLRTLEFVGPETLAYMLLGIAGLRSGMLTGAWPRAAYASWATIGFAIGIPGYAALTWYAWHAGFSMMAIARTALVLSTPLRPMMIVGWACLIVLVARPGGGWTERLAAAGRMAFTNYLATSLICTTIFYGYGLDQFGRWSRAPLYVVVVTVWAAMLGWSQPWLARHRYGPLEWLWRSLARGRLQPMRRRIDTTNRAPFGYE